MSWLLLYISIGWAIRAAMVPIVLRRQFAPGASWAWLGIVFLHPYVGATLYLMFGETRLGPQRVERHRQLVQHYRAATSATGLQQNTVQQDVPDSYAPMILQARKISGLPVLDGNSVEFLPTCDQFLAKLVADINAATSDIHLLYYMFAADETATRIATALIAAVKRGVRCRVLADAVASRGFFRASGLGPKLKAAGVEVAAAMKVAPIRQGLPRVDLRNHRKLAVIDGKIAYAGSHNVINPDYGGRRGNPVLIDRTLFPQLLALTGDAGARGVLQDLGERLVLIESPNDGVLFDVDEPGDLSTLTTAHPREDGDPG